MGKMLSIIIYYLVKCKMSELNENKRQIDNNEEFINIKRFKHTFFECKTVQETTTNDYDRFLNDEFLKMCHKSCISGLSTKHSVHKEIDKGVIDDILQLSDNCFSEELSTENPLHFNSCSQENSPSPELDIEPSITTLYPEYKRIAEYIVNQNIEDLNFTECNPLFNIECNSNVNKLNHKKTSSDEEPLSVFTSESESSLSEFNMGSIINKLYTDQSNLVETSNDLTSKDYLKNKSEKDIRNSVLELCNLENMHKKIKDHITSILTKSKSYIKWYLERLDNVYYMIKELHLFKCSNGDSFVDFLKILDVNILKLLDAINLSKNSILTVYNLNEFATFNYVLTNRLFDFNLFTCVGQLKIKYGKNILPILCIEYVKLFNFFPIFPELITLASLFNTELDYKMILYVRIIYLICEENEFRLQQVRSIILLLLKKLFLDAKRRTRELDITSNVKFNLPKNLNVNSICNNDHSNLKFLIWEFHSDKFLKAKEQIAENDCLYYNITPYNINHFKIVFDIFLFQHIMFLEHHNFKYEEFNEFLESSLTNKNCIFCSFLNYLKIVKIQVSALKNK